MNDISDIKAQLQRYSVPVTIIHGQEKPLIRKDQYGGYVHYQDAVAMMRVAYERGYDDGKEAVCECG